MIVRILLPPLKWLYGLDRSYFFALSAFIVTLLASVFLAFAPVAQLADESTTTLIDADGAWIIVLLVLPVLVVGAPLVALPQGPGQRGRQEKVNGLVTTLVFLAFVGIYFGYIGWYYLPALIFSSASTFSLFFGKRRQPAPAKPAPGRSSGSNSQDGVRLSSNARRQAGRGEASTETESPEGETPLASSRRRRGRRRKR